jgi:hypothetical protein
LLTSPDSKVIDVFPPAVLALRNELKQRDFKVIHSLQVANCCIRIFQGYDSLWLLLERPGCGGFALRTAYSPSGPMRVKLNSTRKDKIELAARTAIGVSKIQLSVPDQDHRLFRCKVSLKPSENILLPFWPRDLYPIDNELDPTYVIGDVHAAQRGLNIGVVFLTMSQPKFGSLLYYQNYTSLNDYFEITGN